MSLAYTPGLKRKEFDFVKKTRRLPLSGKVLVEKGYEVSYTTIIAETKIPGDTVGVNVALDLGCEPEDAPQFIKMKEGNRVSKGDVLAERNVFIKWGKRQSLSPCDGTVGYISPTAGRVLIKETEKIFKLDAYITGKVLDILPNEGAVIGCNAMLIQGIFGLGGEAHGEIKVVTKSNDDELSPNLIDDDCKGKVIVGGSNVSKATLDKAVKVGVSGVVVGNIKHKDLYDFLGYQIGVAVTGNENLGLTLIIQECFGKMGMAHKTFELFEKADGRMSSINGATQIRAGVLRPEIIIPYANDLESKPSGSDSELQLQGMTSGMLVRIIGEPYFGMLGTITKMPSELQVIESESKVRVMEVELENKKKVVVPRANVELIEE